MADPEVMNATLPPSAVGSDGSIEKITVEVAYALPHEQVILKVKVKQDGLVSDAIKHSGILVLHPEIDLAVNKVGMFGKLTKMNASLREGDRIEIYRPLIADPKEVRRKRAAEGKRMKKGGGDLNKDEAKAKSTTMAPATAPEKSAAD